MNFRSREFDTLSLAYIYIYIYIEGERERTLLCCWVICTQQKQINHRIYIYIHTYIHLWLGELRGRGTFMDTLGVKEC
jgi:hypothetical protein